MMPITGNTTVIVLPVIGIVLCRVSTARRLQVSQQPNCQSLPRQRRDNPVHETATDYDDRSIAVKR